MTGTSWQKDLLQSRFCTSFSRYTARSIVTWWIWQSLTRFTENIFDTDWIILCTDFFQKYIIAIIIKQKHNKSPYLHSSKPIIFNSLTNFIISLKKNEIRLIIVINLNINNLCFLGYEYDNGTIISLILWCIKFRMGCLRMGGAYCL